MNQQPENTVAKSAAQERRKRRIRWGIGAGAAALLILILLIVLLRPPAVPVVHPVERIVVQALTASGQVTGAQSSTLAPETSGVLSELLVQEGQTVKAGQVIGRLSSGVQSAQLAQAEANVQSARAVLAQSQASGTPAQRQEAAANVQAARVQVEQARRDVRHAAALARSNAVARAPLEQAQAALRLANAQVQRAQAVAANARTTLARKQMLYNEQAISRAELDSARTAAATAEGDLSQARAQRDQAAVEVANQQRLLTITRDQAVERAQSSLASAQQALEAARARQRTVTEPARPEVIAQQRAALAAAEEAVQAARAQLTTRDITTPYNGLVTQILARPGDAVGPGQGVVRISQIMQPEAQVDVDEWDIGLVSTGQRAVLITDAYPNRHIEGRVTEVGAQTDPQRGTVQVTLRPLSPVSWLREGATVDATIIIQEARSHLLVPLTTVVRAGEQASVMVIENGHVQQRLVQVGTGSEQGVVVLSGLTTSDQVVRDPLSVQAGQRARPVVQRGGQ